MNRLMPTGLPGPSSTNSLLAIFISTGRPLSVLVADIDHFKSINDTYGHAAGDCVLREFAQRLRRNVRGIDLVCRMGGEEFIIVMPDTAAERARFVGERVRLCMAADPFQAGHATQVHVTASVGLATREHPDALSQSRSG